MAGYDNVNWPKVGSVTLGIIISIVASGIASFMIMRVFRGAIRHKTDDRDTILLHGPWIAGAILMGLAWFIVFKGLKHVDAVKSLKTDIFSAYGEWLVLLMLWGVFTLLVHIVLVMTHKRGYKHLFSFTAILGMVCMAFAFGQNDLANAASPGLAGFTLWHKGGGAGELADIATKISIPIWALFGCGILMAGGMFTTYAQRVTRAEVNTASQYGHVALYAPGWSKRIGRQLMKLRRPLRQLGPEPTRTEGGRKIHYDTLRASVITGVSASVIAFASGRGLPVSTTYVAFAAVLGTGLSDRVFSSGDADRKIGRAIWVISCWFIAPIIAIVVTGCVALTIYHLAIPGLILVIAINIGVRVFFRRRADAHEKKYHLSSGPHDDEDEVLL